MRFQDNVVFLFVKHVPRTLKGKVCFCMFGLSLGESTGFAFSLALDVILTFLVFLFGLSSQRTVYSCSSDNLIVQCFVN